MAELAKDGFEVIEAVYSDEEILMILNVLEEARVERKFGIREFLIDKPKCLELLLNNKLRTIIDSNLPNAIIIKSIYFDKPQNSNWVVNWHQDLTINLIGKTEESGFKNWRVKPERTVVQPPLIMLENILTIRIHLDHCDKSNGALRVIAESHLAGVLETSNLNQEIIGRAEYCEVRRGGILLMKPLLMHSSRRVENNKNRRVIHIECCNMDLPNSLSWKEKLRID